MPRRFAPFAAVFLLWLPPAAPARAADNPLTGLDEKIEKGLKDWEVPGLALAVVKDDKVILGAATGCASSAAPEPVSGRTLFAIGWRARRSPRPRSPCSRTRGSCPGTTRPPSTCRGSRLSDPYVTREVTLHNLLSHRCGLDRHELVWYGSPYGRDEVLRRMRHAKPASSFRSKFGYQNVMFLAAGQVVPAAAGKSWDDFVKERLFKPLGMAASNTSVRDLPKDGDVASPHEKIDDKLQVVPWRNIDNVGPAGSINSSAEDMGRWVRLQLGDGTFDGRRLLSSGALAEMHKPQTVVPLEGPTAKFYPHAHFRAYGWAGSGRLPGQEGSRARRQHRRHVGAGGDAARGKARRGRADQPRRLDAAGGRKVSGLRRLPRRPGARLGRRPPRPLPGASRSSARSRRRRTRRTA